MDTTTALAARHTTEAHWLGRLRDQLAFARAIAPFHDGSAAWEPLLKAAEAQVATAVSGGDSVEAAVLAAELLLAPIAPAAKGYTLHCVGHAHIDMNWQWGWAETVATTCDTVRTVLALMDEFPAFTFLQSQVSIYEILRRYEPALLEQVAAQVRAGRWEVVASHWVEGERNCASGEGLARHLLQARTWMRNHLDLAPEDVPWDWVPDCFGHANTIPAIDARGAVKALFMWRSGAPTRPPVFRWQAPDGSELLVVRELGTQAGGGYNGIPGSLSVERLITLRRESGLAEGLFVFGVGDHGGGPTRRHLREIIERNSWPIYPQWRFSRAEDFLRVIEGVRSRLPLHQGELNTEYTGCYTSQTAIKAANRRNENNCSEADGAAALAWAMRGRAVPQEQLDRAWQDTLFGHFHDILPGSGVAATRHHMLGQSQEIHAITSCVVSQSLRALAERIDLGFVGAPADVAVPALVPENGGAGSGLITGTTFQGQTAQGFPVGLVVFNPCAWARREVLPLRIWEGARPWRGAGAAERTFRLRGPDGSLVPVQRLSAGLYWGHEHVDAVVPVSVAALGWQGWALEEGDAPISGPTVRVDDPALGGRNHPPMVPNPAAPITLDNGLIRVVFDRASGAISSLCLADGTEFAQPGVPLAQLWAVRERAYPMSAWITTDAQQADAGVCSELTVVERGPWRAAVRATVTVFGSRFTVTYLLSVGEPWLRVEIAGRWLERGGADVGTPRLDLRFPFACAAASGRYETPFGWIDRPAQAEAEVPALRWAQVLGGDRGCVVANDGKHGHALAADGTLTVRLIRASYDPDPLPEIGDHACAFLLAPHVGTLAPVEALRLGSALNHPLRSLYAAGHGGAWSPVSTGNVAWDGADSAVVQVKPGASGQGLVVRLQSCADHEITGTLRLDGALGEFSNATPIDLLERPTGASLRVVNGALRLSLSARGIVSVRLDR